MHGLCAWVGVGTIHQDRGNKEVEVGLGLVFVVVFFVCLIKWRKANRTKVGRGRFI